MPSDLSYWVLSSPLQDGDPNIMVDEVKTTLGPGVTVAAWEIPELKAGTLSSLLTLSDNLPKIDTTFTQTTAKLLDQLRTLTSDDPTQLSQHARVNDRLPEEYLVSSAGVGGGWRWDKGRWGVGGKVGEVVEALSKEMNSIEATQKQKSQSYNLARGGLTNIQRKKTGNLSQKSLLGIVKKTDLVEGSEFLETLFVAVPKNSAKDWADKYERLTSMVVPRSSQRIAEDDEYFLQSVTVFKKVREEFSHKCRENKFILRDFTWDDAALEKQQKELAELEVEEAELSTDLLRLTRINLSEAYQLLAHLKTIRLFVESVLRYGLPADYAGVIVVPEPKTAVKTLKSLSAQYSYLSAKSKGPAVKTTKSGAGVNDTGDVQGEWATVMEQEYYDFVLFEIPKVLT